jgi:hypothetical protein
MKMSVKNKFLTPEYYEPLVVLKQYKRMMEKCLEDCENEFGSKAEEYKSLHKNLQGTINGLNNKIKGLEGK